MKKILAVLMIMMVMFTIPVFAEEDSTQVTINIETSLPSTVEITGDGTLPEQPVVDVEATHTWVLRYTDIGEYTYQVKQVPKEDGVDYDATVYDIHVSVVKENGFLIARMSINIDGEKEKETTISFDNTKERENSFYIKKVDESGNYLANAKLVVFKADKIMDSWVTEQEIHKLNLPKGVYLLHEEYAPEGYVKVKDFEFEVLDEGISLKEVDNVKLEDDTIIITDVKEEKPPVKPDEPKKDTPKNSTIKTGDNTNIILPLACFGGAIILLGVLFAVRKKKD